jgi:L-ascorbate metabolism protein UlaG (beta-lactamase superfamily)
MCHDADVNVRWHGQSAFTLDAEEATVAIDPFGDLGAVSGGAIRFDYPPVPEHDAHLLLITHEHADHNHVGAVTGDPVVIRSTAGTMESPIGEIVAVSSEHDQQAGTARGANIIFVFTLDGIRVAHFGDLGQAALRPEQLEAIGSPDLIFLPVGDGPTIGPEAAWAIVDQLEPRWVVPMHYRTEAISFLEPVDPFAEHYDRVSRLPSPEFTIVPDGDAGPEIVIPKAPLSVSA